jgi:acyl carrier protein
MNATEIREIITSIIGAVAPEADLAHTDGKADLRDALDIDSMDFLNVLVGIEETLGVTVPEGDYDEVRTLDALVDYVTTAITSGSRTVVASGSAS